MKVTKRSCDVTPRSKYQKPKGRPWSPCASNVVQFRLLFRGRGEGGREGGKGGKGEREGGSRNAV